MQIHGQRENLWPYTEIHRSPHLHTCSPLTWVCWGLSGSQSGLTKHHLLILSVVWASAAVCLSDPMFGDLHSNKEQLTCFTARHGHEETELHSGASWEFSRGGVQTHMFLTRERAACFPVRVCVSHQPPLLLYVCCCCCMAKGCWCAAVKSKNSIRSLPDRKAQGGARVERGVGNPRQGQLEHYWGLEWANYLCFANEFSVRGLSQIRNRKN